MPFGQFTTSVERSAEKTGRLSRAMSDINVTPMVDVMLVLLVIFIIAAPLLNHAVRLELPDAKSEVLPSEVKAIQVSFAADGSLFWDKEKLSLQELDARLAKLAEIKDQQALPEIVLRADKSTRFELIAQVMAAAQGHGLNKIAFATESLVQKPATK